MDSATRLDFMMPIAPLTGTNMNVQRTIPVETMLNITPQQSASDDIPSSNNLEVPELIDLTNLQDNEMLPNNNLEKDTFSRTVIPGVTATITIDDTSGDNGSDGSNPLSWIREVRSPPKHKLPSLINLGCSKVPRIGNGQNDIFSAAPKVPRNDNGQNDIFPAAPWPWVFQSASTLTTNQTNCSQFTPSASMKAHTVTSADNRLQPLSAGTAGTSNEVNVFRFDTHPNTHANIPGPSGMNKRSDQSQQVFDKNFQQDISVINQHTSTGINLVDQPLNQISSDSGLRKNKKKETAMFYQLLDMFPDIDLKFLENQCCLGLNINQVLENILDINDYPKESPQIVEKSNPTTFPNFVVNVSVNNFNIPSSSSSITANSTEKELQLVLDINKNNSFTQKTVSSASSATATVPSLETIIIGGNISNNVEETRKEDLTETLDPQCHFSFLMEVFPDADPNFMEVKSKLKYDELKIFVAELMEKNDYPKVVTSVKQENKVDDESIEIGLYTTNFKLDNFLKIFPDPFGYFLDEKRNCNFSGHGLEFLKRRYRMHSVKFIALKYKEFKHNLVKTSDFLDLAPHSRVTKRGLGEITMPQGTNLPFLQEACFIEHKADIKAYLDGVAEAKKQSYDQAEARGELIDCGCCFQSVIFEDCVTCNEGHLFCKDCVRKSVEVRVGDGQTTFPCLQECTSVFSLQLLETLVDATMFSRLLQRIQLDEVQAADIEGLEICPFCEFAVILPPETNIFQCLNPECLKESCRKCHRLSHIPQRCEELENDDQARARKYIEDEMTRALVRTCYKCKKSFIKMDGCNKMTCTCGAKMCYICREPIVDYKHFNGPGGAENQKCPLYSTEKLLHVDAVKAVAQKALEEVTAKNPELKLKHDPSKILPQAETAKTTLPPGVNEEFGRMINVLQNPRRDFVQIPVEPIAVQPDYANHVQRARQVMNAQIIPVAPVDLRNTIRFEMENRRIFGNHR